MNLNDRITSNKKTTKKPSEHSVWRAKVVEKYPDVYFPTLSVKKNKILKAVVQQLHTNTSYTWEEFSEWVVTQWPTLSKQTDIKAFGKYSYPELDLVLQHYDKLINMYIAARNQVRVPPKRKRVDLSKLYE